MALRRFEELKCWLCARQIVNQIYKITKKENFRRDYGLIDQIQRAAVSIMANIAEGFDSQSHKSHVNFLSYSFRSATEVQSLLYVAMDQQYISQEEFRVLYEAVSEVKKNNFWFFKIPHKAVLIITLYFALRTFDKI
ncbi:MAG: four helix bundle protein [Syntrophothermus sp.]